MHSGVQTKESFLLSVFPSYCIKINNVIYYSEGTKLDLKEKTFILRYQRKRLKRFIALLCIMTEKEKHVPTNGMRI